MPKAAAKRSKKTTKQTTAKKTVVGPVKSAAFAGFDRAALGFFAELASEMNREWFAENKERYETQWVQPMAQLLAEVRDRLAKPYAPVKLGPPRLLRIYRDVRFSKDKAPYKTHISAALPTQGNPMGGCTAMYIHIGLEEEFIGVGTYFFEDGKLAKWRKLVAADKTGKQIADLVAKLRKAGYSAGGHGDYKRVPKPYDEDHPRAELLKMRGLTGGFPPIPRGMLHKRELVDWLVKHGTATAPLVKWLKQV